ncbi:MAG: SURF1 family protein [Methylobacillus sp.]|jgi:surfeit locus 1 family protein|nr:SURF1 family protein [Methylobacillus sp.]
MKYHFRNRLVPALAALLCAALFVRLGLWQQHKAEAKQALQTQLDSHMQEAPTALPDNIADPKTWRYRNVRVRGSYETRYQILLDNQMDNDRAGYHVVTPFHIEGTERRILVNRGWIPAPALHSEIPTIETPEEPLEITGNLWLPSEKFYTLEIVLPPGPSTYNKWNSVWQNMDMKRYRQAVPFELHPLVIRLAPDSAAGGFARNWPQPAERMEMNLSYAYQWYGFAVAAIAIWLFLAFRKVEA